MVKAVHIMSPWTRLMQHGHLVWMVLTLVLTRVDSEEYNATVIEEVIDSQEVDDLISEVQEESDYELEVYKADHGYGDNLVPKGQHICHL